MRIEFTRHVRNRMRRTKLTESEIKAMITEGGPEERSGRRISRWFQWSDRPGRIVLIEEPERDAIVVITVIWPSRPAR